MVAGQLHEEIAVDQQCPLLTSVVAPDAGDGESDGLARERNGHSLAGRESV